MKKSTPCPTSKGKPHNPNDCPTGPQCFDCGNDCPGYNWGPNVKRKKPVHRHRYNRVKVNFGGFVKLKHRDGWDGVQFYCKCEKPQP